MASSSNSISPASFDNNTARLTPNFASSASNYWLFNNFQNTTLSTIATASIDIRFRAQNWTNDPFILVYSIDGGANWNILDSYDSGNAPPVGSLATRSFGGLEGVIDTPAAANSLWVALAGSGAPGGADSMTLHVDQVRLVVTGWP
jgi:hypothetical protein